MDGGAWWAAVHGVAKSQIRLTERLHFHFSLSCIGERNGNPLQCSCLENPRDGGAWWAAIYGVTQSRTQLKWLSSNWYMYRLLCTEEVSWLVFLLSISVSYNIFCILPRTRLPEEILWLFYCSAVFSGSSLTMKWSLYYLYWHSKPSKI